MKTHEAVSRRIRELCYEHHFSANAMSAASGVPVATVKSIHSGDSRNPGIRTIQRLCNGFGITIKEFFNSPLFDQIDEDDD